ncbi:hypothetical protein BGX31_001845 [Mortierella sp. GBA43]|nr:hypothetical protein BGX31_001845 [Mortierella sp. GBA43]
MIPTSPSALSLNDIPESQFAAGSGSKKKTESSSGFSFTFRSRNNSTNSLFNNLSSGFKQSGSRTSLQQQRKKDQQGLQHQQQQQQQQQQPSPPPSPPAHSPNQFQAQQHGIVQYQQPQDSHQYHYHTQALNQAPHPYQPLQNPPQIPIVPPRSEARAAASASASVAPANQGTQQSAHSGNSNSIGSDIFSSASNGSSRDHSTENQYQQTMPRRSGSIPSTDSATTSPRVGVATRYEAELEEARFLEAQIEAEAAAAALAEDDDDDDDDDEDEEAQAQVQEFQEESRVDADAAALYPTVYQGENVTFMDDDDDEYGGHEDVMEDEVEEDENGILPTKVEIHSLPEFFPNDDFGRNAKRYEVYARQRLVALREHQQVLVELLKGLLETDNQGQAQGQAAIEFYPPGPGTAIAVIGGNMQYECECDCQHRRSLRLQRREEATRGFQKAILDLWQADQNLCYWLSRYIRTTRRIGKSLGFILESLMDSSSSALTTTIFMNPPVAEEEEEESAAETTMSMTTTTTTTTTSSESSGEVSRMELVRMGILQSHLLDYIAAPAAIHDYSVESSTLPPLMMAEDLSQRQRRATTLATPPSSYEYRPSRLHSRESSDSSYRTMDTFSDDEQDYLEAVEDTAALTATTTTTTTTTTTSTTIMTATLKSTPLLSMPPVPSPAPYQQQYPQDLFTTLISRPNAQLQDFDEVEAAVFIGSHMQSLHKANEFLNQFNQESLRSRDMMERFKVAKAVYDHYVMNQPSSVKASL